MWKKVLLTISAIACAIVNTSCNNDVTSVKSYNPDEECTISISWWGGDDRHDATLKAIELFENENPNIHVDVDYGSWNGWKNKIFEEYESDTCTDVIQVNYDWLVTLSYDGSGFYDLEKLGDYIDLSNFSDDILQFGRRNNVLNALPVSITGRCLFYNQSSYDKVGAELPNSWDDLFNIAPKFKAQKCYPLDVDNKTGFTAWYLAVVYEQQKTGKEFITSDGNLGFTVDDITDALQFYKDLQDAGAIRSVSQINAQIGSENLYDSKFWTDGTIGGIVEWGSSVSKYQATLENPDSLVMGNLLTMDNALNSGWMYKPSLLFAINKNTKYPVQSAKLLDFLYNNPEGVEALGTTRGIPVSTSAVDTLKSLNMLNGTAYDSNNLILNSNPILISPYMENSDMQSHYNEAIEAVSLELLTPSEAAQGMYANIIYTLDALKEGK